MSRPVPRRSGSDQRTRQRVFEVAAALFAERGFRKVTVREICRRAKANVAAVNYHFRDKMGLYTEVVWAAIETMRQTREAMIEEGQGQSAEQKLRTYIRIYLSHLVGEGRKSWIHKLMAHELADPSPALDLVAKHAIRPRIEYLGGIVRDLLGPAATDAVVNRSVGSIQGQCLLYAMDLFNPAAARFNPPRQAAAEMDQLADHITEFSLAGIRSLANSPPAPRH